jgi:TolB protein
VLRRPGLVAVAIAAFFVGASTGGAASARRVEGSAEIYSLKPDGSDRVDLSNNAANDKFPVESPKGDRIAFVSDREGYDAVYLMYDDGSDQHRLTDRITESQHTICHLSEPVWSPSGTTIAYTATCELGGDPRNLLTLLDDVASSGGLAQELATGGSDPTFSADGRFIAFQQQLDPTAARTVGLVTAGGGLAVSLGPGYAPAWSPTGHRLAFHAGGRGIAVVNAARPTRRWTFSNRSAGAPSWSPRGGVIAFFLGGARPGIYVVRAGGRRASRVVGLGESVGVTWSPDGRWLALVGEESAYVVARDGRFLQRVGGPASVWAWSPNSTRIAWADTSLDGLAVTNPRSRRTVLAASSTALYGLTWTRNSRRIVFAGNPTA